MKKILFVVACMFATMFVSCNQQCGKNTTGVDTDSVAVDTVIVDSAAVDSMVCPD